MALYHLLLLYVIQFWKISLNLTLNSVHSTLFNVSLVKKITGHFMSFLVIQGVKYRLISIENCLNIPTLHYGEIDLAMYI